MQVKNHLCCKIHKRRLITQSTSDIQCKKLSSSLVQLFDIYIGGIKGHTFAECDATNQEEGGFCFNQMFFYCLQFNYNLVLCEKI